MKLKLAGLVAGVALLGPAVAAAEEGPAAGLMQQSSASSGSTEVGGGGFAAATKPAEESKDATELKISAGGLLATGNTRSMSGTTALALRVRRTDNQLSADAAANYAQAAPSPDEDRVTTVENLQGKLRYDRFVTGSLAGFVALTARRDRFQGLNLRLNLDPGFAYYVIDEAKTQLWAEAGYDLQYDVRRDSAREEALASTGQLPDKTETRHSARVFVGYSNALSEMVTFKTGVEYLQGLPETQYWRLNWDSALSSQIGGNFSVATSLSVRYDNAPLPTKESTDVLTAVSLVYTLL